MKEMFPRYNKDQPPPSPGELALAQNPETFERELIFGMMRHYRFYIEMRDQICPRDAVMGVYRRDFITDRYNVLFQALDAYWRKFDNRPEWANVDLPAPEKQIEAYVVDWINIKTVNQAKTVPLLAEARGGRELAREITLEDCRAKANSSEFKVWMEGRICAGLISDINKRQNAKPAKLADLQGILEKALAASAPATTDFCTVDNLVDDPSVVLAPEIIKGLLRKATKMSLSGSSKARKTFLMLDLATAVATGTNWLGFPTNPGNVLIADLEMSKASMKERSIAVCASKQIDVGGGKLPNLHFASLRGSVTNISDLTALILKYHREKGPYDLIIIDPVYKLLIGQDENQTSAISSFCAGVDEILKLTGAAVLYVGHFSKGNQAGKSSIDRISGSGIYGRDADSITTITDHSVPDCEVVELVVRDFPPVAPFVIGFTYPLFKKRTDLDPKDLRQPNNASKEKIMPEDVLESIPGDDAEPIANKTLEEMIIAMGSSERGAKELIQVMVGDNSIYRVRIPRKGAKAAVGYRRSFMALPSPTAMSAPTDPVPGSENIEQ